MSRAPKIETRVVASGLGLPTEIRAGRHAFSFVYSPNAFDGEVRIAIAIEDPAPLCKALGATLLTSNDAVHPNFRVSQRDAKRIAVAFAPAKMIQLAGREVPATWRFELLRGGSFCFHLDAPGLFDAIENGHGQRLGYVAGALVERTDVAERAEAIAREAERARQIAELEKRKAAFAKLVGAKRVALIDEPDDGLPYLRAAAKLNVDELLALQKKARGVLLADDETYRNVARPLNGVRFYAEQKQSTVAVSSLFPESGDDRLVAAIDALESDVGARVVIASHRSVTVQPTRFAKSLAKTRRAIMQLYRGARWGEDVEPEDTLRAAAHKQTILFRWE